MRHFKNILKSILHSKNLPPLQEDPMVLMKKRKLFITKLAYRYLTWNVAVSFDKLYNSKYVIDNRKVADIARMLKTKYVEERKLWLKRKK